MLTFNKLISIVASITFTGMLVLEIREIVRAKRNANGIRKLIEEGASKERVWQFLDRASSSRTPEIHIISVPLLALISFCIFTLQVFPWSPNTFIGNVLRVFLCIAISVILSIICLGIFLFFNLAESPAKIVEASGCSAFKAIQADRNTARVNLLIDLLKDSRPGWKQVDEHRVPLRGSVGRGRVDYPVPLEDRARMISELAGLANTGNVHATERLIAILKERDIERKDEISRAISDDQFLAKKAAIHALGKIGDARAIAPLKNASKDILLRDSASSALSQLAARGIK